MDKLLNPARNEGETFEDYKQRRRQLRANARLIDAAPEMLSELENLLEVLPDGEWQETKSGIRQIVNKVKGAGH